MNKISPPIRFHLVHAFSLRNRKLLQQQVRDLFEKEKQRLGSLDYIFCNDAYLLNINQQFLQHDDYTDIITFDLSEPNGPIIGEIYISVERVKENALAHGEQFLTELRRVMFHGALHLCGYKDKSNTDIKKMREKEAFYLSIQ